MRVMVTGATGYVGSRLVPRLLDDGHQVIVTSRHLHSLAPFGWSDAVLSLRMDVNNPASVRKAFAAAGSVEVVYYLVHGIGQPGFHQQDIESAQAVADAARATEVRRIIYLGGFVPSDDDLSPHLQSRAGVGEALGAGDGADLVWLRAAMIIGAGSTSFEIMRYLADRMPVLVQPGWMTNPMDPISIVDVVHYLACSAESSLPPGAYDISGPDSAEYQTALQEYVRAIRQPRFQVRVPWLPAPLAGRVAGLMVPVPAALVADLIASLNSAMNASEHRIRELVPQPADGLTSLRTAVEESVDSPRPRDVTDLARLHHLATTDPDWAGGDVTRLRRRLHRALRSAMRMAGVTREGSLGW